MTLNQLQQVATTYATRRDLWLTAIPITLTTGATFVACIQSANRGERNGLAAAFNVGSVALMIAYIVTTQAKWHFCNPRARLTPHFNQSHLALLLALIILGATACPLLLSYGTGWNLLGLSAYAAAILATFIWSTQSGNGLYGVAGTFIAGSLATRAGWNFWLATDNGSQSAILRTLVAVASWAALLGWLQRLARLSEESTDYDIPLQIAYGQGTRLERTIASRAIARHLARSPMQRTVADWWHDKLTALAATSDVHQRQATLRYGFGPMPAWTITLFMMPVMFGVYSIPCSSAMLRKSSSPCRYSSRLS